MGHLTRVGLLGFILLGLALRMQRLDWQPLWWDEGYSIYFATEALSRMLFLTAHDIHPPLYYALLHTWFWLFGDSGPVTARLFSVGVGTLTLPVMAWAARALFPARPRLAITALVLLALNPMHVYYSQEVRMYALALPLTVIATVAFMRLLNSVESGRPDRRAWAIYAGSVALSLLTLYYSGLIFAAHQLWAVIRLRHKFPRLIGPFSAGVLGLLAQTPWLVYTLPRLLPYIDDKVRSDQDTPLALWTYVWRHLVAFSGGHLEWSAPLPDALRLAAPLLMVAFIGWGVWRFRSKHEADSGTLGGLLSLIGLAGLLGFLINLRLPFFPVGGERLLLTLLPYTLLLVAWALSGVRSPAVVALSGVALLLPFATGLVVLFTVPRYGEHDYRPIIRHVTTYGRAQDSVLALFPWQVGYWRAYTPREDSGAWLAPQPQPLDQTALQWTPQLRAQIDDALAQGSVWFPAPLSFGSTLPAAIEAHLQQTARALDNRWFGNATRLSAWSGSPGTLTDLQPHVSEVDFGPLTLRAARVVTTQANADNSPIAVDLLWQGDLPAIGYRASLRLLDAQDRVWAQRDITPVAQFGNTTHDGDLESLAFLVPAGVVPGDYRLTLGVAPADSEELLLPHASAKNDDRYVELSTVRVDAPVPPPPPARLPRTVKFDHAGNGLRLIGSGPLPDTPTLAGTEVMLDIFAQTTTSRPELLLPTVKLVAANGVAIDAPYTPALDTLPDLPVGTLLRLPGTLYVRPDLAPGSYRIELHLPHAPRVDKPVTLGEFTVTRRAASFAPPQPPHVLPQPVQFGTHVELIGYAVTQSGSTLEIDLSWRVLQTLLPPHAIFVHVVDADGTIIAQQDGAPHTAIGPAPTGSWLPDEWLVTQHRVALPPSWAMPVQVRVGLYLPTTEARLPATVAGEAIGDFVAFPLP